MKTKLLSFMIISFILVAFAAIAQAAPAGKVTNLDGRADVTVANKPAKGLIIGDTVNVGDIIRTKSASKCEVTFTDGSIIRLAENSRLKVTEYNLRKESRTTILSLFRGKVQNVVTATSKLFGQKGGSKYEVHTPTAVCGVRGTTFFSYHQNGVSGALFTEGQGYVYSKGQPGVVKPIAPGIMMVVTSANKPPESRPAKPEDSNKFFQETTPSDKKKDIKKDGDDKGNGGAETSGGGKSGSGSSASGSSGSGSGDSAAGGTGGTTLGGTTLSGTTVGTTLGGTTGGITPTPIPPVVIPPVVPPAPTPDPPTPDPLPPAANTTFSPTPVNLGSMSGTLTGDISAGTLSLTGTGPATTSTTALSGTLSDGSTYNAYLAGIPGSWSGLFTGIAYNGGTASLIQGSLSDPNYTSGGALAATGSISRGAGYSVSNYVSDIYSVYNSVLPVPWYFIPYNEAEVTDVFGQGYQTSTGGVLASATFTRTGGVSEFPATPRSLPYYYYQYDGDGAYLTAGNLIRTDDGSGHFQLTGDIHFMNDQYYGLINMNTQGIRTTPFIEGLYNFNEIGVATYNLDPLKYHGNWGTPGGASFYYNDSGTMSLAGHEEGLIGGTTQAPWTGVTDFKAIGQYISVNTEVSGGYAYYLWNTDTLNGYDPTYTSNSTGGYFEGVTAGIWGSSKKGAIRAIYVTPVVGGSSTAGILTSDDIAVGLHSEIEMWMAQGTLGPYSGLTYSGNPASWAINYGTAQSMNLHGSFSGAGSMTGSGLFGTEFLVVNSASPPWGIYNLKLSGATNAFSGKPLTGDAAWSAGLGGMGQFGYNATNSTGYWLANLAGGVWTEDGQITGNVSGIYLTPTYLGNIVSSPFYGVSTSGSSGSWIGESIGIYTGTPLTFSSNLLPAIWSYNGTWSEETNYDVQGLLGGTTSLWDSSADPLYVLGQAVRSGSLSSEKHIFNDETYSYNTNDATYTTYDGGSYFLLYGGNELNGQLSANIAGLYVKSGKAGFLRGGIGGNIYNMAMWEATGSLTKEEKATTGIPAESLYYNLWGIGQQVSLTGSVSNGSLNGSIAYNRMYAIYNTSAPLEISLGGIWQASLYGSGLTESNAWTAKMGGSGVFGPYHNKTSFVDDPGYWLSDISGSAGLYGISATISGKYMTETQLGIMDGNLLGTYNDNGTWSAATVGTYQRTTALAFASSVDNGTCGYFDLNPQSATYNKFVPGDPTGQLLKGIIGSTMTPFIGVWVPLSGIGTYAASANPLWKINISKNLNVPNLADSLNLWFGGIKNSTSFQGKMMGLYANWNGTNGNYDVGYLTTGPVASSPVTGNLYSGIGMWEITGGSLTYDPLAEGYRTLDTTSDITPAITESVTPQTGTIVGTGGISGVYNRYDMYFTQTNGAWGVWRVEAGGTYTSDPTPNWYGSSGSINVNDYSLYQITGTNWADGQMAGTISGRWLSSEGWGRYSGDIVGVYSASPKTWQALALGKQERTETLAFSSSLTGNLYQVVAGNLYNKEYQRPYSSPNNGFAPLRYEAVYFVPTGGIYNPTTSIGFEWGENLNGPYVNKNEYHYYPNGKWVKVLKGMGITVVDGLGDTNSLLVLDPPNQYSNFDGTIVANPATPFVSSNSNLNYVAATSTNWATNALMQNGAFTGIMGGLNNISLWSSTSTTPTNLILMGSHDAYNGSQMFATSMSYDGSGTSNGAYIGLLTGIIRDTDASENPLDGLIVGLYVDPAGNAGVLKGNFIGTSYTGINMWESTDTVGAATLYRDETLQDITTSATAATLASDIFRGVIGAGVDSAVYGTFGGNGSISSPLGIMGSTYSLDDQPGWGIFNMQVGLANTYSNPESAGSWTATMAGSGVFGKYTDSYVYADLGYWYTDLPDGVWSAGKMTGTFSGKFLTLKKMGTLEGSLLGTYDGTTSGSWQATSAGTYVKTQDVLFSSEIQGKSHTLISGKTGKINVPEQYSYEYWYNDTAGSSGNYGNSTYYNNSDNTNTFTKFDIQGPTNATYHKDVWAQDTKGTEDTDDDTYTFSSTPYSILDDYNTDMAGLATNPGGDSITQQTAYRFQTSNFNGILAGVDNLWTKIGSGFATPLYLMGDIEKDNKTPKLFTGTVVSVNPLNTISPYANSTSPIGGAYFAYLGGAFGTKTVAYDTLAGLISGLYLNPDGSVGVLYGTIDGSSKLNAGYWKGTGEMSGYKLLAGLNPVTINENTYTVTPANFASMLSRSYNTFDFVGSFISEDTTDMGSTGSSKLAYSSMEWASLDDGFYGYSIKGYPWNGGNFGVYSFTEGGTYTPEAVSTEAFRSYTKNNVAHYVSTTWDATVTNGIRSGSVLHDGIFDPDTATGQIHVVVSTENIPNTTIMGADIKGLFDPAASTWQIVGNGKFMETAAFVNLVDSFTTDEKNAFMSAMKIPAIMVGSVDLAGSRGTTGNSLSVTMAGVNFYAYSTGQTPKLFATNNVQGSYDVSTLSGGIPAPVTLTAGYMSNFTAASATFTPTTNFTNGKWGAQVTGSGTMTAPSANIVFKGGAAGTTSGGAIGTITSGTAAGVVGVVR